MKLGRVAVALELQTREEVELGDLETFETIIVGLKGGETLQFQLPHSDHITFFTLLKILKEKKSRNSSPKQDKS